MIRRHPEAILLAHRMDPERRELYVEGHRDRLFLSWLLEQPASAFGRIREIGHVDIPVEEGGERGRLIRFAEMLSGDGTSIRMFADADWDRVLGRHVPERVWLTDHRDMEGYVLRAECVDKVLALGVATDRVSGASLLNDLCGHCRRLGLLRLLSERDGLSLPFQATRLGRFARLEAGRIRLNFDGYLRALLQNAQITLSRLQVIRTAIEDLAAEHDSTLDSELVHGKDATCLLDVALSGCGVQRDEAKRLLWCSFEPRFVETGTVLEAVLAFLRAV